MPSPLSRRQFLSRSAVGAGTAVAVGGFATGESAAAQETELEALVDDAADRALTEHDAGGLTVAVVDGDDVLTHGYGHAYRSEDVPVRADETLFERFAPVESGGGGERAASSGRPERADELGGRYRSVHAADNATAEKLLFAFVTGEPIDVRVADDGRLITEQGVRETSGWRSTRSSSNTSRRTRRCCSERTAAR
ncbi:hypothetical protein [Halopelagius fulvigenes]|uniref:Twin-arginine translocation signal domain-containing protein n=1 Tax=Halopelagius fulvigenes TaxID=1198324 RepID=A0ABD5TXP1_9EURY